MQNKTKGFSQIVILLVALVVVSLGYVVFKNINIKPDQGAQVLELESSLLSSVTQTDQIKIPTPIVVLGPTKNSGTTSTIVSQELTKIQSSIKQKADNLTIEYNKKLSKKISTSSGTQVLGGIQKVDTQTPDRGGPSTQQNLRHRILYMGGVIDHTYNQPYNSAVTYTNDVWDFQNGQALPPPSAAFNPGGTPGPWPDRVGFGSVYFNGKLWLLGGWDGSNCRNDIWSSIDGGRNWVLVNNNASFGGRASFTLTVFQNKIYIIGGTDCNGNALNDIWTSTDGSNWLPLTSNPLLSRMGHQTVVLQNKLVITGGFSTTLGQGYLNDVLSSSDGINWTHIDTNPSLPGIQDAPWTTRANHSSQVLNGKIYVFGGLEILWPMFSAQIYFTPTAGLSYYFNQSDFQTTVYSDVWSSSDGGATWLPVSALAPWGPREEQSSVVMNNRMYLIGGSKDPWSLPVFAEHDFWQSPDGLNWIQVTPNAPWIERANAQAVVVPPGYGNGPFPPIPDVSTLGPTALTNTSIDLLGSYNSSIPNIEYWFETWNPILTQTNHLFSVPTSQVVTQVLNSLMPATNYFYRMVAQNNTGISYGSFILSSTDGCAVDPLVRIIYPNGSGESFIAGQQVTVTWDTCNIPSADIGYIGIGPASGGPFITQAPYYISDDGNETLQLPSTVVPGWYKATVVFPPAPDFSDAPFWIN